ncbi:unnamed protein product [Didymodactylos carnosus]|uniref:Fatty acid desaturase domain-containing protein n=1 Tax=Didymodactylos carnosus TaxID=1234261 RepID=A0A813WFD2_9BILA|nr:unnamed protein product [Didymodactylos carnosus]CAF3642910.1 unnamed protein product [Didymodactylos carnosus]
MVALPSLIVLIYIITGYIMSIILLLNSCNSFSYEYYTLLYLTIGTCLLAHVLTWSGYMHHELCHNSVFEKTELNLLFGHLMDWLNGACYWPFEELKMQHINHHVRKVEYDVMGKFLAWIEKYDTVRYTLSVCEYVRFMQHRTIVILSIRLLYFSFFWYFGNGPLILICYLIAYSISIQIMRFTDTFSHDYELIAVGTQTKYLSKTYDMLHTYSIEWDTNLQTPIMIRFLPRLVHSLFFLNFNFHNQHHYATQKKWYELGYKFTSDENVSTKTLPTSVITQLRHQHMTKITKPNTTPTDDDDGYDDKEKMEYIMNHQPDEESKSITDDITIDHNESYSLRGIPKHHFTIPLSTALYAFHTHRLTRLFSSPNRPLYNPLTKRLSLEHCYGITDAPLLVLEV